MDSFKDRFVVDWLTFSFCSGDPGPDDITFVASLLNLDLSDFENIKGFYGYKDRLYFSGISIHFNGSPEMGICVECSGSGCRALENFYNVDWYNLFTNLLSYLDINVTRLDIAYDSFNGLLPFEKIIDHSIPAHSWYTSFWRSVNVVLSTKGDSVTFGSRASLILFRIYDKAAEQGTNFPWIRAEIQLRDDRATSAIRYLLDYDTSVGVLYSSILSEYLTFREPSFSDSNKSRWEPSSFWLDFLSSSQNIKLFTRLDSEYDFEKLCHYVYRQSGHAIKTLIKILGTDEFFNQISQQSFLPNKKYVEIIKKCLH